MKTIKQIADTFGIEKQKVYRYIRKHHINDAHQQSGVMYFDDVVVSKVRGYFLKNKSHHDAHQATSNDTVSDVVDALVDALKNENNFLKKQLEIKDQQIADLTVTIKTQAESINYGRQNELAETIVDSQKLISEHQPKKSFFRKLFGRN